MSSCEDYQSRMLEYLYDLLEGDERQALERHVEGCAACQAALARVRDQQRLLAAAARMEFPSVTFTPPPEPKEEGGRRKEESRRGLVHPSSFILHPFLKAAAVLLVVGGLGGAGAWLGRDYIEAQRRVQQQQAVIAQARQDHAAAELAWQQAPAEQARKIETIHQDQRRRQLKMVVTGPDTVQSGAPTVYQVRTDDLNGQPAPAQVTARVADSKGRVSEPLPVEQVEAGLERVTIPADLPVAAGEGTTLVVSAQRASGRGPGVPPGAQAQLSEQLRLARPVYVTHLTTDKPMYQPGEVVHFRSLTLERSTFRPPQEQLFLHYRLTPPGGQPQTILRGSSTLLREEGPGKPPAQVLGPDSKPVQGIGAGDYLIPADAPGGEYILSVSEDGQRFPEQERKFLVNRYEKPQLDKELDYSRKSYGPGDEVLAQCKATRAGGGPVADQPVETTVQIDGKTYGADGRESNQPIPFRTDAQGAVTLRFRLPAQIERGLASLSVQFHDGGNVETLMKPLPIVLKKLEVEFFPEGGDLVAELPNRVYFQVRTPLGKPADLKGRLLENGKPLGVTAETLHDDKEPGVNQGMGRFEFTPRASVRYELQVDSPVGITEHFALPAVRPDGVVLRTPQGVVDAGGAIPVTVRSVPARSLLVGAYCRGQLLDSVHLDKGQSEATLKPASGAGGVCRVTVFEELAGAGPRRELKPVAERLVYRRPAQQLRLALRTDRQMYVPGQKVRLDVEARDEQGRQVPALAMVAVVDRSVVKLADEKTARTMPTHFLLTTEVRRPEDLEYADFLLGSQPRAAQALDLLLGTQGWRRFAEQDPAKFRQQHNEDSERLLVMIGQSASRTTDFAEEEIKKVQEDFRAEQTRRKERMDRAKQTLYQAEADPGYRAALVKLKDYDQKLDRMRHVVPAVLGTLCVLGALLCLLLIRTSTVKRSVAYLGAAGVCAAGCVLMLLVLPAPDRRPVGVGPGATGEGRHMAQFMRREREQVPEAERAAAGRAPGGERDAVPAAAATAATSPAPASPVPPPLAAPAPPQTEGKLGAEPPRSGAGSGMPAPVPALNGYANNRSFNYYNQAKLGGLAVDKGKDQAAFRSPAGARRPMPFGLEQKRAALPGPLRSGGPPVPGLAGKDARKELATRSTKTEALDDRVMYGRGLQELGRQGGGGYGGFGGRGMGGGGGRGMAGLRLAQGQEQPQEAEVRAALPPLLVREYAHQRTGAAPEMRSDFAETLYWHPVLVLPGGKAEASFDLCDSVTTFQATAYAHTLDGRLGAATSTFDVRLPFTLRPRTPLEVTAGDQVDVPLGVVNNSSERRTVQLALQNHQGLNLVSGPVHQEFAVPAEGRLRKLYRFRPAAQEGEAVLVFQGKTEPFAADSVRASFRVVPEGFPVVQAHSDVLEKSATQVVVLPQTWVKGTLQCRVQVFPSTLADLQKGLDSLLREPTGCFEQTSTSNYPNLLILDYLKESDQARPELERRCRELLARGYRQLTSFECQDPATHRKEGYEWFGGTTPPHEALTAYGLLEFRDMARVQEVDPAMLRRTQQYLLAQRDGQGGFKRNPRALDSFGRAPQDITNAYIVWALTESGKEDDLGKELAALKDQARTSKDPYFLSLVANSLINRAQTAEGAILLRKVAAAQKEDGHLDAERTSITGSGGRDLQIETTALAVLGWLKANPGEFNVAVRKAVEWIGRQRGGYGGFGSTQSTILALKALIAYTRANKKTPEAGELHLDVGERHVASLAFAAGVADTLTLSVPDVEKVLQPGRNVVRVEITGKNVFPYTLSWSYQTLQPPSGGRTALHMETRLSRAEAREGDSVRLTVRLENVSGKGQGMAVAIIGLPGGLTVPEDMKQLKDYALVPRDGTRPLISSFEIRGRELVLYWRDLAPGQKIEVPLDLVCRVPGVYSGPASRAYLYYNADRKHWVEPLHVTIAASGTTSDQGEGNRKTVVPASR